MGMPTPEKGLIGNMLWWEEGQTQFVPGGMETSEDYRITEQLKLPTPIHLRPFEPLFYTN